MAAIAGSDDMYLYSGDAGSNPVAREGVSVEGGNQVRVFRLDTTYGRKELLMAEECWRALLGKVAQIDAMLVADSKENQGDVIVWSRGDRSLRAGLWMDRFETRYVNLRFWFNSSQDGRWYPCGRQGPNGICLPRDRWEQLVKGQAMRCVEALLDGARQDSTVPSLIRTNNASTPCPRRQVLVEIPPEKLNRQQDY